MNDQPEDTSVRDAVWEANAKDAFPSGEDLAFIKEVNKLASAYGAWDYDLEAGQTHPVPRCRWVKVTALIRNNASGEIREYPTSEILDDGAEYPGTFNWQQGNYSCDCNREIFFEGTSGHEERACSEGRFSVNLKNPVNGEIYYREFQTP